jgi:hypothetical protein
MVFSRIYGVFSSLSSTLDQRENVNKPQHFLVGIGEVIEFSLSDWGLEHAMFERGVAF